MKITLTSASRDKGKVILKSDLISYVARSTDHNRLFQYNVPSVLNDCTVIIYPGVGRMYVRESVDDIEKMMDDKGE